MISLDKKFLIVGLGLIGGSYASKLSSLGYKVYALDLNDEALEFGYSNSFILNKENDLNLVKEFMTDEVAVSFRSIKPTYTNKTVFASFKEILPEYVLNALKGGIIEINKKLKGFLDDDAIITIVESRSSSPVRILRENYESNISGVYPIGEGAGYAGGITSSALDGIKCALKIIEDISGGSLC